MDKSLKIDYDRLIYEPQNLLGNWLLVSFFFVTTALLFYHMVRKKVVRYTWFGSAFALFLMFISISFLIFSIKIYYSRMNVLLDACLKDNKMCSKEQYENIKYLRDIYTYLSSLVIISKGIVIYFLIFHVSKYL